MELQASLPWLALTMTPGIAARPSARLLREFGSPEGVFRARLTPLEACDLPAPVAHTIFKRLVNWTEPEYPQSLLQIYDPPVVLYVHGDASVLSGPSLAIVGRRRPTVHGKLVTNAEDVIEELPTPIRAALVKVEGLESEQRNWLPQMG